MKAWDIIKKVFMSILTVVYFAFALIMTILLLNFNDYGVTQFTDTSIVILKERIANEEYKKGDVVFVERYNVNEFKEGETVFTYRLENTVAHIEIGEVGEIYTDDKAIAFKNGDTYSEKYIIGKPSKVYHGIGSFLSIIESTWGFLFVVLVPCFLLFIYQIYALIIEIKYGKDEE